MAANEQRHVTMIICAYGHWGTLNRTPKEIVGYGMYLDDCISAITHLCRCGWNVTLILCGGAVENEMTEAETMDRYLKHYLSPTLFVQIRLESKSLSTPANLDQARQMISHNYDGNILVVCDWPREFKVKWLVKKILHQIHQVEVVAFARPDINPRSTRIFQIIETIGMMLIPPLLRRRINKLRQP